MGDRQLRDLVLALLHEALTRMSSQDRKLLLISLKRVTSRSEEDFPRGVSPLLCRG